MKTKIKIRNLAMYFIVIFSISLGSCTNEDLIKMEDLSPATLKSVEMEVRTCDLIAGQHIPVGIVSYEILGDEITVKYETNGWFLSEIHIYVGPKADLPRNKKAIKIGHFPINVEGLGGSPSEEYTLPFDTKWENPIIAAHAVVFDDLGNEETAWAKCECSPLFTAKTRLVEDATGNSVWGLLEGEILFQPGWCSQMGFISYDDGTYDLYELGWANRKLATLTIDGNDVKITPEPGFSLCNSHVWVGAIEEIEVTGDGCPDYANFVNSIFEACSDDPHEHEVSVPECQSQSISFKDPIEGFGSSRWGWFLEL